MGPRVRKDDDVFRASAGAVGILPRALPVFVSVSVFGTGHVVGGELVV